MFGHTRSSPFSGLLIFAALSLNLALGATGCRHEHPDSVFEDVSPPECSVVHGSGLQTPPEESPPDKRVPCEPTACEPDVCDPCPECEECTGCPEPVECPACEVGPDVPDARGCLSTVGSYPVTDDQVPLTSMNLNIEWTCSAFSEPWWTFTSTEDDPLEFLLLPTPDKLYRVEVRPITGRISLGYEEGDVEHDDETGIYTWYLVRWSDDFIALGEEEVPARLHVISLTPESRFKVQLKRGE